MVQLRKGKRSSISYAGADHKREKLFTLENGSNGKSVHVHFYFALVPFIPDVRSTVVSAVCHCSLGCWKQNRNRSSN